MYSLPHETISQLLQKLSYKNPNHTIIIIGKKKITRFQLINQILRVQSGLVDQGLKKGDRVLSLLENSYEQIILFFSCVTLGIIWVPIGPYRKGLGLNYIISLIKPNLIFSIKKNSKNIPMKFVNKIFNITKELKNLTQKPNRFLNIKKQNQISCILFTSGTTGPPKGVIVSQKMLLVSAYATGLASDVKKNDKFLLWESLHHIGGIEVILLSLLHDIQIVLLKKFSATNFWNQIRGNKITKIHYLGGILDILLKLPKKKSDRKHNVKLAFGAGAREETYSIFRKRFNLPLREVYGMTEASSFSTINFKNRIGSIGQTVPWFKINLSNIKKGVGEIVIKEKKEFGLITKGYYKDRKATKQLLKKDGLHTGDLAKKDKKGNLFFLGRIKDSVRVKGENISAWEIESNLNNHKYISESAILGTKAEIGEEEIVALLVSKFKKRPKIKYLIKYFRKKLLKNYLPRYWGFVESLPRTPTLRVDKKLIKLKSLKLFDIYKNKTTILK